MSASGVLKKSLDIKILVDGNTVEKKNNNVNESLQFTVGKDRVLYEVFISWVRKDSAGGYLRIHAKM